VIVFLRPSRKTAGRCPRRGNRCPSYDQGAGRRRWRGMGLDTVKIYCSLDLLERCEGSLERARKAGKDFVLATEMYGERPDDHFAVSYGPEIARASRVNREERLSKADVVIEEVLAARNRAKDPTVRQRGRKLTADGVHLRIHDYLRDHEIGRLYEVRLDPDAPLGLSVTPDQAARVFEHRIDGILRVEGSRRDLSAEEMVARHKALAEIERSWRASKSMLRVRPVSHWTEARILAHVFLCVLALFVERVIRKKLRATKTSVPAALEQLKRIRAGQATASRKTMPLLTHVEKEAREIYEQLDVLAPRVSDVADHARAAVYYERSKFDI
jgi:DNA-binding Lrp family transcriptional regulator